MSQPPQTGHVGFYFTQQSRQGLSCYQSQSPQTGHVGFYAIRCASAMADVLCLNPLKRVMLVSIGVSLTD